MEEENRNTHILKMLILSIKNMQGHGYIDSDFLIQAKRAEAAMNKNNKK